jgi:CcmD family protein
LGYLFGAYLVMWAITFGYLYVLGTRQRRLEQELSTLVGQKANTAPRSDEMA